MLWIDSFVLLAIMKLTAECRSSGLLRVNKRNRHGKPSDNEVPKSCCDSEARKTFLRADARS
ncbi:hypothetical protein [Novipirellula caenicola]|uniref:hypothetical protein n=1 Tax=Novipirellula caenicola TaxID=1536901 RepID=UPI0031EC2869